MLNFIAKYLGYILEAIYNFLAQIGIENLGISIVIFAFLVKLLMFPLTFKQQKSSKLMMVIQPELSKIQKKYRGKKDQESMMAQQQETMAVYKKYGMSQTGGCLPMLLQLPIMFALVKVIYDIPSYIPVVNKLYMNIANPIVSSGSGVSQMKDIAKGLTRVTVDNYSDPNQIVSLLSRFKASTWDDMTNVFSQFPDVVQAITDNLPRIHDINNFMFGINIAEYPSSHKLSLYLLIPFAAAFFQWLSTKTMKQPDMGDNPMGGSMKVMMNVMPIMSFFIYLPLPSGIGLYWASTALATVIQQVCLNAYFNHKNVDAIMEKQMEKAKKKNKKTMYERLMEADGGKNPNGSQAAPSTVNAQRSINKVATISTKKITNEYVNSQNYDQQNEDDSTSPVNAPAGSITAIANMMLDRDKGGK